MTSSTRSPALLDLMAPPEDVDLLGPLVVEEILTACCAPPFATVLSAARPQANSVLEIAQRTRPTLFFSVRRQQGCLLLESAGAHGGRADNMFKVSGQMDLAKGLQDVVKARLTPYKCPRRIEFLPELPKSAAGKFLRYKLREFGSAPDALA